MMIPRSIQIATAIKTIRPKSQFANGETYESLIWNDTKQVKPTKEEFNRAVQDYDLKQYQRDRASQYPSTADQLDMLYHQGIDGWKAEIKKVKDQFPKPE